MKKVGPDGAWGSPAGRKNGKRLFVKCFLIPGAVPCSVVPPITCGEWGPGQEGGAHSQWLVWWSQDPAQPVTGGDAQVGFG